MVTCPTIRLRCCSINHTAKKSLGNCPPLQVLKCATIDISILLNFLFWDIVYVSRVEDKECHGQIGMHYAKSYRPFELFVNENYKL